MWHFCDSLFATIKKAKENLNMKKELLNGLSEELIEKVKHCKTQDELLALAKHEGIELNDEQLAAVTGGGCTSEPPRGDKLVCPKCGSHNPGWTWFPFYGYELHCPDCDYTWEKK